MVIVTLRSLHKIHNKNKFLEHSSQPYYFFLMIINDLIYSVHRYNIYHHGFTSVDILKWITKSGRKCFSLLLHKRADRYQLSARSFYAVVGNGMFTSVRPTVQKSSRCHWTVRIPQTTHNDHVSWRECVLHLSIYTKQTRNGLLTMVSFVCKNYHLVLMMMS